ncbi:MAG TPA: aminoacyl-tRNA hydrolase [Candidatus Paceibacterota bacterium]|nr:aminoacyl-tRNA hydrolase [Candidatus Paceibacterota bacterium]
MDQTLIIGLGNPDPALETTYHNVGALAVQWLAERASEEEGGAPRGTIKFRPHGALFAYAKIQNRIFIRPLLYMNESGRAVAAAMRDFGAKAEDIIVIHDDSDITVGEFKRAQGGGSAGHKGVQSIIDHLHTADFARIRIGIREKDEARRKKAEDFVLSPITTGDRKAFEAVFEKLSLS